MNIYPVIQFDILFIYTYIIFVFFTYCNIVATHTHTGNTGPTFT